jgi:hypothetical protein
MCALQCSGRWRPAEDARPCDKVADGDLAATPFESGDGVGDCRLHDGSLDLLEPVGKSGSHDSHSRITSTRTARLARRAVVAIEIKAHDARSAGSETGVHRRPDSRKISSWTSPVVVSQQGVQPSNAPAANSPSALSRSATNIPTWMPTSCGTPGSTCGGGASGSGSGTVAERGKGAGRRGFTSSPPLRAAIKRGAESEPQTLADAAGQPTKHPLGWVPSTCGYPGATCGGIDGSGGSGGALLDREVHADRKKVFASSLLLPLSHAAKRETESQPAAEALPLAEHTPGWVPSSCTGIGVTCGRAKTSGNGSGGDGTAGANADSRSPAH